MFTLSQYVDTLEGWSATPGRSGVYLAEGRGRKGGLLGNNGKLRRVILGLERGLSIRAAAREAGCSRNAARRAYHRLMAERERLGLGEFLCPCGRPSTHMGWCRFRYLLSPDRQSSLKEQRERFRSKLEPPPHGKLSRYTNQGCRCDLCREASRVYRREYYLRKRGAGVHDTRPDGLEGAASGGPGAGPTLLRDVPGTPEPEAGQ